MSITGSQYQGATDWENDGTDDSKHHSLDGVYEGKNCGGTGQSARYFDLKIKKINKFSALLVN